jgi:hypothetical protein
MYFGALKVKEPCIILDQFRGIDLLNIHQNLNCEP